MRADFIEKKEEMALRYMTIVNILENHRGGDYLKAKDIADILGLKVGATQVSCKKLVHAGVLESATASGGGYKLKSRPKVGHLYMALGVPQIMTGNKQADIAFRKYLQVQL
jgi:DNA-binding IscR family transcriptional regulator